jgi:ketosteroid isomerase-like protein
LCSSVGALLAAPQLARAQAAYNFVTTDKKGKSTDEKRKYVVVWKKQTDGSWKAAVDIDSPDQ